MDVVDHRDPETDRTQLCVLRDTERYQPDPRFLATLCTHCRIACFGVSAHFPCIARAPLASGFSVGFTSSTREARYKI